MTVRLLIVSFGAAIFLWCQAPNTTRDLLSIQAALQSGDLPAASRLIDSSLKQHPNDGGLLNLRGIVHARRNQLIEARHDFAEATRLAPELIPAWQNLARACDLEADKDASSVSCAIDSWQHVLLLKPADIEAHTSLALLYERKGKVADARKVLEQVALLEPKNPAHLLELARLADDSKDYEGALGYLAHARDIAPENPQIHFLYAKVAMELNLVIEARRALDRALAIDPQNPAYNYAMGFVILRTRDAAAAAGYFKKFVNARPQDVKGHYALGIAYFDSGDYASSKAEMAKAQSDPKIAAGAEYFLGRIACIDDKLEEAARHLRKSIELLPSFSESHTELARVWMLEGDLPEAHKELDRALQLDPQSFQGNERLLVLYRRTHDSRAGKQSELVKKLDANRSRRAELMLRTIEFRP